MNRRWRAKLLNTVVAGLSATLILVFMLNYLDSGSPPSLGQEPVTTAQAKYFIVNANSRTFNKDGLLDFTLSSQEIRHNPKDGSARLKAPHIELFRDGVQNWITDAQLGIISGDGKVVTLQQRVVARSTDQSTVMNTPKLMIYPEKKLAKTSQPVTLRNPYGFTRSIGLEADMNQKRIDLLQQVRGQYQGVLFEDEQ